MVSIEALMKGRSFLMNLLMLMTAVMMDDGNLGDADGVTRPRVD